jgi:hypothetical protein
MQCYGQVILGTAPTVGTAPTFGLPAGFEHISSTNTRSIGIVRFVDTSTSANTRVGTITPSGSSAVRPILGDSDNTPANVGATVPFTWAVDDQMVWEWTFTVVRV